MDFRGKIALVTWSSGGIGKRLVTRLASLGMHIVITGRAAGKLNTLKNKVQSMDSEHHMVVADISNPEPPWNLIRETIEKFGRPDILLNKKNYEVK